MTRGTTPTLSFSFDEVDIKQIKYGELTISQNGHNVIIKKLQRNGKIYFTNLSEIETLQLRPGNCDIQAKVKLKDGNVIATDIETIVVNDVLNGEVML